MLYEEKQRNIQLLNSMIRMACDAVLIMDKLAGFKDTKMQNKLIKKYEIYFRLDLSEHQLHHSRRIITCRANEEKDESKKFFLLRCRDAWFKLSAEDE